MRMFMSVPTWTQGEPPLGSLRHKENFASEGSTDQVASGHASQAVPRKAPQYLSALHASPPFNPLPAPADHCRPWYPPHLAASYCVAYGGHSASGPSITSNSGHANYPSDYPYFSSYDYDSTHVYDTHCPVRAGYSDSGYPCHDHDYGTYTASSNLDDCADRYGDGWSVSTACSADSDYADNAYDDNAYDACACDDYACDFHDASAVHSNHFYPTLRNQQHLPQQPTSNEAHLGDQVPSSAAS
ncbi:hypothetical protein ABBQ38_007146 [Trebouxia sp. C0009 RCD-2024]